MHSMFEAYQLRQRRRNAGPSALRNANHALGKLDAWMTEHGIDPLAATADDRDDYKVFLTTKFAPSTVKLAIVQVRAAYANAHRQGLIAYDPAADLLAPRLPEVEPETFTTNELRAILATVPTRRHEMLVRLMAFGGLRPDRGSPPEVV
jgi:site-specific recombinase XerD